MAYKDLQHLTRFQVNELVERYYNGEKISVLLRDYDLDVPCGKLFFLLPPSFVTSKKDQCEFCGVHLIAKRKSRTAFKLSSKDFYCPRCGHKPYVSDCDCARCTERRNNEIKMRKERIKEAYKPSEAPVKFDEISFRDKVYLGILSRTVMDDTGVIGPLYKYRSASRISPTREYTSIILSRLIDDGLILVDPDTDLRMLDCQSPNFPYDFNMDYVQYLVDVNEESLEESFQILAEGDFYNPETDVKGAAELWKELAVEECFEYLTYHSKDVGFGCPAQHKPRAMLNFLLDSFSVSQVFSIISNRLSYASKAFLSANGKMTRTHALNYTVSGCYSFGTNAINKGWKIYSYNRPYGTKLPSLCDYFYNSVLKIGENCFYLAPTFSNLERFSCALQYINR